MNPDENMKNYFTKGFFPSITVLSDAKENTFLDNRIERSCLNQDHLHEKKCKNNESKGEKLKKIVKKKLE